MIQQIKNTTINKYLGIYKRKNNSCFIGIKNIHHKINVRSHLDSSNITPYYWYPCEFDLQNECNAPLFN